MAQAPQNACIDKKGQNPKSHTVTWMVVCCGQSGDHSTKRAPKGDGDGNGHGNGDDAKEPANAMERGLDIDFERVTEFGTNLNGGIGHYGNADPVELSSTVSAQSVSDDNLSQKELVQRLGLWLKEEADEFVFYFSGEGSKTGIGLKDGVLSYKEMASIINANAKNDKARVPRPRKDSDPANVTIVLDTCHSGAVESAFEQYRQPKFDQQCSNERGALFHVMFSSKSDQLSIEDENGGIFTAFIFDAGHQQQWFRYLVNGEWKENDWTLVFRDDGDEQDSGCFDYRPQSNHGLYRHLKGQRMAPVFVRSEFTLKKELKDVEWHCDENGRQVALKISPEAGTKYFGDDNIDEVPFYVKGFHVACQSARYNADQNFMGIVLYRYGKPTNKNVHILGTDKVVFEVGNERIRPGYIYIEVAPEEYAPGYHGTVYQHFFQNKRTLSQDPWIGGGFSVWPKGREGVTEHSIPDDEGIVYNSGTFNACDPLWMNDHFHGENKWMNDKEKECIKKAVIAWKNSSSRYGITVMVSAMDFGSK